MDIGVDISRNHITAGCIVHGDEVKAVKNVVRIRIDKDIPSESLLELLCDTVYNLQHLNGGSMINCLGVSIHAPFNYGSGTFCPPTDTYTAGFNLRKSLSECLLIDDRKISFNNDTVCFLRAELLNDSSLVWDNVVGLKLGTGLGAASYEGGKFKPVNLCNMRFRDGVAEDYLSEHWFANRYFELTGIRIGNLKALTDDKVHHLEINQIYQEFALNLTQVLLRLIKLKRPFAIVLGGTVVDLDSSFIRSIQQNLYDEMGFSIPLHRAELGKFATILGATISAKG